jgi:hypothetical protein
MANKFGNIININETPAPITPSAGVQSVYAKPDGFIYAKNLTGTEYLLNNPIKYLSTLNALFPAVAQANTTRVPVTGWSFPVVAGKSYKIEINANYSTAAAATGGSMGFTLTTAVGSIVGNTDATIVNTGSPTNLRQSIYAVNAVNGTAGSFLTTTGMTLGGIGNFKSDCIFTCTTSGTFVVNWGTEVALSLAQLRIGSTLCVTQLN